ncbi:hypothetical protein FRC18_006589, partial [Serendipita sp. 400]
SLSPRNPNFNHFTIVEEACLFPSNNVYIYYHLSAETEQSDGSTSLDGRKSYNPPRRSTSKEKAQRILTHRSPFLISLSQQEQARAFLDPERVHTNEKGTRKFSSMVELDGSGYRRNGMETLKDD